ncbi:hypothetical protein CC80DRAFT_294079 [Byssothecium circinans]|uniref:Uncharacterized protein n=1 Tax=Byssothecium circinans TaxID=147558 RepID=A0A6A5U7Y5_9PLEO|nr:hypothetical protein CC80DRAFT_294079 [Byssothecium circinans]
MTTSPPSNADLQTLAYNNLNTFFTAHQDAPVEIEILLPCFEPEDGLSMQDGPNIGIPKEILVLAFLEARARFFRALSRNQEDEVHVYSQVRSFLRKSTLMYLVGDVASA